MLYRGNENERICAVFYDNIYLSRIPNASEKDYESVNKYSVAAEMILHTLESVRNKRFKTQIRILTMKTFMLQVL